MLNFEVGIITKRREFIDQNVARRYRDSRRARDSHDRRRSSLRNCQFMLFVRLTQRRRAIQAARLRGPIATGRDIA